MALAVAILAMAVSAYAIWTGSFNNASNDFNTDTLNPPTSLAASVSGSSIKLDWTATPDTYADNYKVLRATAAGGPYSQIATVTPVTTATYTDSTAAAGTRYYYVLQTSEATNWLSVNSNEANSAVPASTGFLSCTANAAVTTNSGDNNGFQTSPANACANDAAFAEDLNGGTANSASCTSTARDRHLFYNYGFSIPAGQTINGIEVRLDAWADSTSGNPAMCVELSWDGGATWTTAKTSPNLTTAEATYILGSATDAWGRTWNSANDFTNANFRVRITNVATSTARDFRLDWVAVQVTYSPP
ncbi:MAG: hypothetical protein Q7R32_11020 [Dehalococcoidia bacterium]|nr:hypothetical protein [Dehalococcoidia bacterium]